jgi:hypothetical protein
MTRADERQRTLHLVDLENLTGGGMPAPVVREALLTYLALARWTEGDCVQVAAPPRMIAAIAFELPVPCNLQAVTGEDAADLRLLCHSRPELLCRFGRLVIGSGDHIFVERALQAKALGVGVLVISRIESCAKQLMKQRHGWPVIDFPLLGASPVGAGDELVVAA